MYSFDFFYICEKNPSNSDHLTLIIITSAVIYV